MVCEDWDRGRSYAVSDIVFVFSNPWLAAGDGTNEAMKSFCGVPKGS